MENNFITVDLGAESGRCVVAAISNKKIQLHEVHRFKTYNYKDGENLFWSISDIFQEIIKGLKNASKEFGPDFKGIGIDTWGVDYVLMDEKNELIHNPYHYRDDRTDGIMDEAFKILSKEKIYKETGIQFLQINTIFQLLAEKKNNSENLLKADKFLLIPDYLNFLLTGKKYSEYSIASTTSLINPLNRKWSEDLIDIFDLPRKIFPEIIEPGNVVGNILSSISEKTGISTKTPVIAVAEHDTASAVVSIPANEDNWAFLSSGTWSLIGIELNKPLLSDKAMEYNFTNEGGAENTVRFLKNITGLWPVQECNRFWNNRYEYSELTDFAEKNGFAHSWVNLNDYRFLKPGKMPEKIVSYLKETDQNFNTEPGFIIRVALESLAFSYRRILKDIENITGKNISVLHAVGGGIQNNLLNQLTADAIGIPFITGPVEGTVAGNAGIQVISSGIVNNLKEWREIIKDSFNLNIYKPINSDYFNNNESKYKRILNPKFKDSSI